jgi:hypothetical protein
MDARIAIRSVAALLAALAIFGGAARAQSAAPIYNPPPGYSMLPLKAGYSWTFRDARGNLRDIRCPAYDARTRTGILHNLSGKGEYVEVVKGYDRYGQPIVNAREIDGTAALALWGKLFQSRYSWTWTGTDDACLEGLRHSAWYSSATEPAGVFLRPLVFDIDAAPGTADCGLTQIVLERGIGFIEQSFQSIMGPQAQELVSAKTAIGQIPAVLYGVQTSLSLDPPSFTYPGILPAGTGGFRPPMITATFEARVPAGSRRVVPLTFRNGQRAELEVYDNENRLVYRWSDGRVFDRAMFTTEIRDGKPFRFTFTDVPMPAPQFGVYDRYRFRVFITDEQAIVNGNVRFAAQELMQVTGAP